jgi:hypothetical protein
MHDADERRPAQAGAKQPLDQVRVEVREVLEGAVPIKHPVGDQQVQVRMPVQQFAGRVDEPPDSLDPAAFYRTRVEWVRNDRSLR